MRIERGRRGRPVFVIVFISYNARYVKYREVKKPSFPVSGSLVPSDWRSGLLTPFWSILHGLHLSVILFCIFHDFAHSFFTSNFLHLLASLLLESCFLIAFHCIHLHLRIQLILFYNAIVVLSFYSKIENACGSVFLCPVHRRFHGWIILQVLFGPDVHSGGFLVYIQSSHGLVCITGFFECRNIHTEAVLGSTIKSFHRAGRRFSLAIRNIFRLFVHF